MRGEGKGKRAGKYERGEAKGDREGREREKRGEGKGEERGGGRKNISLVAWKQEITNQVNCTTLSYLTHSSLTHPSLPGRLSGISCYC